MPSTIVCPNCRRPQEESGRLTCPDCSAILPSNPVPAMAARPAPTVSSALDEFSAPVRPTGAMTLLRNDLRSEEKTRKETGWLDNIITKKPKETTETAPASKARPTLEAAKPAATAAPTVAESPVDAPKARPLAGKPPASTASFDRFEHSGLAGSPIHQAVEESGVAMDQQVSIPGVVTGVAFIGLASLALLQGKDGLLGIVLALTTGILGASLLAIWQRRGARKAFWQGFAVFGFGYLAMAFVPIFPKEAGLELPTARVIRVVHAKLAATPEDPRDSFAIMKSVVPIPAEAKPLADTELAETKPQTASFFTPGDVRQFTVVGQCGLTLLSAFAGAALARWFHRTSLTA